MFTDRQHAAEQLLQALAGYRGQQPLVLGIPRGAVPMARQIADGLQGELDVVLVRKLGAPWSPELAIGAVDESEVVYLDELAASIDPAYIREETQRQLAVIRQRRASYTPVRAAVPVAGRLVIVVDDGLATGATMLAALQALRRKHPARLVCAVPVAPPDTLQRVQAVADEVVCLRVAADFSAVGQFYRHFDEVNDAMVVAALRSSPPDHPR
ncbi:phosphoribosyltransferase [Vogesella oryzae]|uniref:phosphoribosyltransferase n=1 Tax=Vogesella oryzae TaxID=1735285 RepID=UPI001581689A|nr:phosphoribosyltransferase family protein [Vogesella oryzae]